MPRLAESRDDRVTGAQDLSRLKLRWQVLCGSLNCPEHAAADVWQLIERHYSEPQRHYHTLAHVAALLRHADAHRAHLSQVHVVELAIWFHDIIYDPRSGGNETASAALASAAMQAMQVDSGMASQVEACILATIKHAVTDTAVSDLPLFLDFDLAILGAPVDVYQIYREAIRREYAWVPEQDYRAGRAKVLRRFLERPALYFTPWMAARFEAPARDNIQSELLLLEPHSTSR
jgi:predicted metal-dependent HD superfamily phosphohydrolase